ncbi:chromosome 3 open reading frame 47 [Homo sapiens]|uniref:Putative uncharacterized protein H1-10-AS1 n=1 Tax=Homo sapiens TaxID=9606 RepID=H1AS1_HUMAN
MGWEQETQKSRPWNQVEGRQPGHDPEQDTCSTSPFAMSKSSLRPPKKLMPCASCTAAEPDGFPWLCYSHSWKCCLTESSGHPGRMDVVYPLLYRWGN